MNALSLVPLDVANVDLLRLALGGGAPVVP